MVIRIKERSNDDLAMDKNRQARRVSEILARRASFEVALVRVQVSFFFVLLCNLVLHGARGAEHLFEFSQTGGGAAPVGQSSELFSFRFLGHGLT